MLKTLMGEWDISGIVLFLCKLLSLIASQGRGGGGCKSLEMLVGGHKKNPLLGKMDIFCYERMRIWPNYYYQTQYHILTNQSFLLL